MDDKISNEILETSLDLTINYGEIGLDSFVNGDLAKDIPILQTLVGLVKTGVAIKQKFFIKKFIVFLKEFHSNSISNEKLEEFKENFKNDKKYREKITDQIFLIIEDIDSIQKSQILVHLFNYYIDKKYDWDRFIALVNCLKNLQEITYQFLKTLSMRGFSVQNTTEIPDFDMKRYIDLPPPDIQAIRNEMEALLIASGIGHRDGTLFSVTKLGQDLYYYGISKV